MKLGIAGRVNGIEVTDADYEDTHWAIPEVPDTLPSLPDCSEYDDEPPTLRNPPCRT